MIVRLMDACSLYYKIGIYESISTIEEFYAQ